MSYVQVPTVPRDGQIASSLMVQDYIRKHIKGEKDTSKKFKPRGMDSPFGNFPTSYKMSDRWDGNPTLRRGFASKKSYLPAPASLRSKPAPIRPKLSRPKTAPAVRSQPVQCDKVDMAELEATRAYLKAKGKFRTSPTKLMAALEVSKVTNTRPLSAPGYLRNSRTPQPPKAGAWRRKAIASTLFRKYYARGDLPICVDHRANGNAIKWKMRTQDLDYHVYLPIFFDGLREVEDPFRFLAIQGTLDMIEAAPEKVLPVIPQLILPMKTALNTRTVQIICPALKILQQMILLNPMIGQALVPYYRQLLPVFNLFKSKNLNLGDSIDYNQRSRLNVGELIHETLEVMEQFGGPDAFINMLPTYESCCS